MLRLTKRAALASVLVFGLADAAAAQQFSANLLIAATGAPFATASGKIHVAETKVRIETPDLPDGFFLVDTKAGTAYFLRPAQQVVMDAKETSRLTQLLVPVDPDDPCRRWQAMAVIAGATENSVTWRCARLDGPTIEGRPTIHYRITAPHGEQSDGWIDSARHFLVKLADADGTQIVLSGITDEPQPDKLFEIPDSFRRFDPLKLIEHIKQSDVWVDVPH